MSASAPTTRPAWAIVVPMPPSPNRRLSRSQRHCLVKPLVESAESQARALGLPEPLQRARVLATLTYPPGRSLRDPDNAVARLKTALDALVRGGLLVDAGPSHLELEVRQTTGDRRAVIFEIFPGSGPVSGGGTHAADACRCLERRPAHDLCGAGAAGQVALFRA
jgi:hypothetical protein